MICRNPTSLCIVKNRRSTGFIDDIVLGIFQICFLLLPEKVDMKFSHKRCKLVVDILKNFGLFFERIYKTVFKICDVAWYGETNNFLQASEEPRFAGTVMRRAKKKDRIGTCINRLDMC